MNARNMAMLAALVVLGEGSLVAAQLGPVNVGDFVRVQMTGELAEKYYERLGADRVPPGLTIETTAAVVQKLADGHIRIEHTSQVVRDREPHRLVTLTATVESSKLVAESVPSGTAVYASPGDPKDGVEPTLTTKETQTRRLTLSDLQGLKLRTWTLADEVGD